MFGPSPRRGEGGFPCETGRGLLLPEEVHFGANLPNKKQIFICLLVTIKYKY